MRRIPDNRVRYVPGPHVEYLYVGDDGLCSLESGPIGLWLMYKRPFGTFGFRPRVFAALSMDEFLVQGSRRQYLFSSMDVRV